MTDTPIPEAALSRMDLPAALAECRRLARVAANAERAAHMLAEEVERDRALRDRAEAALAAKEKELAEWVAWAHEDEARIDALEAALGRAVEVVRASHDEIVHGASECCAILRDPLGLRAAEERAALVAVAEAASRVAASCHAGSCVAELETALDALDALRAKGGADPAPG